MSRWTRSATGGTSGPPCCSTPTTAAPRPPGQLVSSSVAPHATLETTTSGTGPGELPAAAPPATTRAYGYVDTSKGRVYTRTDQRPRLSRTRARSRTTGSSRSAGPDRRRSPPPSTSTLGHRTIASSSLRERYPDHRRLRRRLLRQRPELRDRGDRPHGPARPVPQPGGHRTRPLRPELGRPRSTPTASSPAPTGSPASPTATPRRPSPAPTTADGTTTARSPPQHGRVVSDRGR